MPEAVKNSREALLALLMLTAVLVLYAVLSMAAWGGIWVPAKGYGAGDGYWLVVAPDNLDPYHGHDHVGSVALAANGSEGYLMDANGRDDVHARICDDYRNFRDAMAFTRRVDANGNTEKYARTFDGNGVEPGCGNEILGFSGERHSAYENSDYGGGSGESNHKGF